MPPSPRPGERELWRGAGDAWTMVSELLTATAVWAAVGYGLDRWIGTWPVLFAIGATIGHATGIYMLWRRLRQKQEAAARLAARLGEGDGSRRER